MSTSVRPIRTRRRALAAAAATTVLVLTLAACGSSGHFGMPGMDHNSSAMPASSAAPTAAVPGTDGMPGMGAMAMSDGLASDQDGYRLDSRSTSLPAGRPADYAFAITGPDARPVTDFAVDQTKQLHFYAIRSDLTGYQHVHPTMAPDGTWTAGLAALTPGTWRLYTAFTPNSGTGKGKDFVLSRTVTVPGTADTAPLPPASTSATADGYTLTVQGELMSGMAHPLTVTVSKDGRPVTDLEPYLDSYAHLSAFHEGDQAFAHLHPETAANGDHGGPLLNFQAELAKPGNWRVYLQFQTAGQLHTAALTVHVN